MLAIVTPDGWPAVADLCARWEVRATVVGRVVAPDVGSDGRPVGRLRIRDGFDGEVLADVPAASLAHDAPLYDRPRRRPSDADARACDDPTGDEQVGDPGADLLELLVDPAWVHRQYDTQLFLNTVVGPGRDAALLRLQGPGLPASSRGIAITTDSNPRWCALDPRVGTALTVAEGVANLACVGATAKAVVNCLNFGNPEHPEVMWQLSEAIDGMAEACQALGLPVIGGNVSLYNESAGVDIDPTPVIGLLGVVESLVAPPPGWAWREGDTVLLVGTRGATGDHSYPLAGSRWATRRGRRGGRLAGFDAEAFATTVAFVVAEIAAICAGGDRDVTAVHDVGAGGIAVALAEVAAASGCGVSVPELDHFAELFSEFPGRFLVATFQPQLLARRARSAGVESVVLGVAGGNSLRLGSWIDLGIDEIAARRGSALTNALTPAS
jgi:phosphoribosylformylglycinamidine synthase